MGTTIRGLHYPDPTEPVANGATAIHTLATDVDTALGGKSDTGHTHAYPSLTGQPQIAGGKVTKTFSATGQATIAHGLGTTPTAVQVTTVSGGPNPIVVVLDTPTSWDATNIYLRAINVATSVHYVGAQALSWLAIA